MSELHEWDKESLATAKRLLELALKDCHSTNTTIFDQLLNGMIDTKAANEKDNAVAVYKAVIQFCADRIFTIEKQRKTVKLLKDVASEYSSRNEFIKKLTESRSQEYLSVGEHGYNSLQDVHTPYPHEHYQEQLKAIESVFTYYSSDDLRTRQRKLTGYANGIKKELLNDKLKSVLPKHEQDTIGEAVGIIRNLKQTIEHAKERKARNERYREQEKKERESRILNALNAKFNTTTMSKTNVLNFALFIAEFKHKDGFDRKNLIEDARRYVDNSRGWYFTEISDYIKQHVPHLINKACFKTADFENYEQVQKTSDAVEALYSEWQLKQADIFKQHAKLFEDLKTKNQVDEMKQNLTNNS